MTVKPLTRILGRTWTPILGMPSAFKPLRKVLITHSGREASARAVRDFVLFAISFDIESDLVVSGMQSMRPLHDFHIGSFIRRLIEDQKKALFLSHETRHSWARERPGSRW